MTDTFNNPCGNVACRKFAHLRCARCRLKYYCSVTCQTIDWACHKSACTAPSESMTSRQLDEMVDKAHRDRVQFLNDSVLAAVIRTICSQFPRAGRGLVYVDASNTCFYTTLEEQKRWGRHFSAKLGHAIQTYDPSREILVMCESKQWYKITLKPGVLVNANAG